MSNWQLWLTLNFKVIQKMAKRWHPEEWGELISHFALYLRKNWSKFSKMPDGEERLKFTQTWMKNNVSWSNSEFNRSIRVNNFSEDYAPIEDLWSGDIETRAEDLSEDLKEFVVDLERRFDEVEVRRIILIRSVYLTLDTHEKVLYDLYFSQMLSIRGVAKKLNLPMSAVYGMLNDLKNKIQKECGL